MEMPALEERASRAAKVVTRIDDRRARLRSDALRGQIEGISGERTKLRAERLLS